MSKPWVYIAGPYSHGDVAANVHDAVVAGLRLREAGCVPIIPHLFHFVHYMSHHPYEYWMEWDFDLLDRCDFLVVLPGESPGALQERARFDESRVFEGVEHALLSLKIRGV